MSYFIDDFLLNTCLSVDEDGSPIYDIFYDEQDDGYFAFPCKNGGVCS